MPKQGDKVTQNEIDTAVNIGSFNKVKPDSTKNWHQGPNGGGLFEPWSTGFGYDDGFPLYGGTLAGNEETKVHIYYLPKMSAFM